MRRIIRREASALLYQIHKTLCAWPPLCYDAMQRLGTAFQARQAMMRSLRQPIPGVEAIEGAYRV